MESKVCSKCGEVKPICEFSKCAKHRDGLHYWCKPCCNSYHRAWYSRNTDHVRAESEKWRQLNPERNKEIKAEWYAGNRERMQEKSLIYYREHREEIRVKSRVWYEQNKEKALAACRVWRKNNPESRKASEARRRTNKISNTSVHYTADDLKRLFEAQTGCCYCDADLSLSYHVDHVIPLSRGGGNGADNICLACPECNMSKGNKMLFKEWIPPKFYKETHEESRQAESLQFQQASG